MKELLKSFRPLADERSRILILGTMPGPVALARKEYYGFPGNHFWKIIPELLGAPKPASYREKIALLREHRIAIWDTIKSCTRVGAGDADIKDVVPNDIAGLVKKYPNIQTIFLNGRLAEKLYRAYHGGKIKIPAHYLPSTSPAHASLSYEKKLEKWKVILEYLKAPRNWC